MKNIYLTGVDVKLAPIQLKRYFITHLNVVALKQFNRKELYTYDFKDIQSKVHVTENKKQPNVFQVSLTLKHIPQPKENLPYAYSMQIIGFFEAHLKWPKAKIEELVKINGPAVLYGAAREILAQTTGRGPWGAILLPSANFLPKTKKLQKRRVRSIRVRKAK